jgi:type II secretion system protein N
MTKKRSQNNRARFIVVTLLFVGALVALWPTILTLIFQTSLSKARSSGLRIAWQGVSASYLSARAGAIEVWIPGPPIEVPVASGRVTLPGPALKVEINDLSIVVDPLSLIRLAPRIQAEARLYGGDFSADIRNILGNKVQGELKLQGVSLDKHPQIRALGFGGGAITIQATNLVFSPPTQTLLEGNASVQLSSLSLPARPELALIFKGERLALDSLSTTLKLSQGALTIEQLELSTSLGGARGRGTIILPNPEHKVRIDSNATVSLTKDGAASLGQWLPLISNGALSAENQSFSVTSASTNCSDKTLELPFGCIRVVFSPKGDV